MIHQGVLFLLIMAFFTAAGQTLLRKGAIKIVRGKGLGAFLFSCLNFYLGGGLLLALLAPLLYIKALHDIPLSQAFMFNSLTHLLVFLSGRFILKERARALHWVGLSLIVVGFLLPVFIEWM